MSTISALFNSLANRGDSPGLLEQLNGAPDLQTRAYYNLPAIIPGTSAGAFAVNDLCNRMLARGATPRYLGATFAIDPDMVMSKLRYVANHTAEAAVEAEVEIASADTAIVDTGLPCGIGITLTAVGEVENRAAYRGECISDGDVVIITGRAGAHGAALFEARNRSLFIPPVLSDSTSLGDVVSAIRQQAADGLRMMYYPADGVSPAMAEIEKITGRKARLHHDNVPVAPIVAAAAHSIGCSPLSLATAGAMIAIVAADKAEATLAAVRRSACGRHAAIIARL